MVDPFLTAARQLQNVAIVTNIHGFDRPRTPTSFLPTYQTDYASVVGLQFHFNLGAMTHLMRFERAAAPDKTFYSFLDDQMDGLSITLI